jgi:mRNA-degrading endonuclease toxin of MazEF toxin-antitoxin module
MLGVGGGIDGREDGRVSMAQAGDRRTIRICRMDVGRALAAQPFRRASRRQEGQGREAGIDMQDQERKIRRFDLFWLNLEPPIGAETRGTRPCLIVSPDAANEEKQIVSIAPITSNLAKVGESGVSFQLNGKDSVILLDRITTVDKNRLGKFIGQIDSATVTEVARALNTQFIPEDFAPQPITQKFVLGKVVPFDEDRRFEFKEIMSPNPAEAIKDNAEEYAVAFLNSEGGRIFWGIRDGERTVVGVKLSGADRDDVRKAVMSKLNSIQPHLDIVSLKLTFHEVSGGAATIADLFVVELAVPRGEPTTMYFTGGDKAFVRLDGVKQKLKGPQIQQWIMARIRAAATTEAPGSGPAVPPPESPGQLKRKEIIPWIGKVVTLSQMNTGRAVMLIGPVAGSSVVKVLDCTDSYVTVEFHGGGSKSIALANIEISFDNAQKRLDLQERYV